MTCRLDWLAVAQDAEAGRAPCAAVIRLRGSMCLMSNDLPVGDVGGMSTPEVVFDLGITISEIDDPDI